MSADNWGVCPKCFAGKTQECTNLSTALKEAYGKIPAQKYLDFVQRVERVREESENFEQRTLREDYEIWIDEDGIFSIDYRSRCDECKFSFSYKHSEKVPLVG